MLFRSQEVLFFPQMKPEKRVEKDPDESFTKIGIPLEWVPVVRKAGYQRVKDLLDVENTNKLHQDLCGINKKNKLGLPNPSKEDVAGWINQ